MDNHIVASAQSRSSRNNPQHPSTPPHPTSSGLEVRTNVEAFLTELKLSKRELDIARNQFEVVTEPLLVDHVVFRLGAAERHFNYMFQLARRMNIGINGLNSDWYCGE